MGTRGLAQAGRDGKWRERREISNLKSKIPNKFKMQNAKYQRAERLARMRGFEVGASDFFGIWDLGFEI
jgi:hypothetical protein